MEHKQPDSPSDYQSKFDNLQQSANITAFARLRSANVPSFLHPVSGAFPPSVHQMPTTIKNLTTFPYVLAEHLYYDKRKETFWISFHWRNYSPMDTLREEGLDMGSLADLSDELESAVLLIFDMALRKYFLAEQKLATLLTDSSISWRAWKSHNAIADTFDIVAQIPVTDMCHDDTFQVLFQMAWSTISFNARMQWTAARIKDPNAKLRARYVRDYLNPQKHKESAKSRDYEIAALSDGDFATCKEFGAHCHMGLLTLQTTTLHIYGLPDTMLTGSELSKLVLARRLIEVTGRKHISAQHIETRPGYIFNMRTDQWMPSRAAIVCLNEMLSPAEILQFTADAECGATYQLQFSRSAVRCFFTTDNKVCTEFPSAPVHSFDTVKLDGSSDMVYCKDGRYKLKGAVNFDTHQKSRAHRFANRAVTEPKSYVGTIARIWRASMQLKVSGSQQPLSAAKRDNSHLSSFWNSLNIGDAVSFHIVNERGYFKAVDVKVQRQKEARTHKDRAAVLRNDYRRGEQYVDSMLVHGAQAAAKPASELSNSDYVGDAKRDDIDTKADDHEAEPIAAAEPAMPKDGRPVSVIKACLEGLLQEQLTAETHDADWQPDGIRALRIAIDTLSKKPNFVAHRITDLEAIGIDMQWKWIAVRLNSALWNGDPAPADQNQQRLQNFMRNGDDGGDCDMHGGEDEDEHSKASVEDMEL